MGSLPQLRVANLRGHPVRSGWEKFQLPDMGPSHVLVEPIIGCWEANMAHALARKPIDICRERGEEKVVLGNSGVVRVVKVGAAVTTARVGDVCMVYGGAAFDE